MQTLPVAWWWDVPRKLADHLCDLVPDSHPSPGTQTHHFNMGRSDARLSTSPFPAASADQGGSVELPVRLGPPVIESLLGGGPNGFTGRGRLLLLLFRRMLDST